MVILERSFPFPLCSIVIVPFLSTTSSDALIFPSLRGSSWSTFHKEPSKRLTAIQESLSSGAISPSEAADTFSSELFDFLASTPEFSSHPSRDYIFSISNALSKFKKNALRRLAYSRSHGFASLRSDFYRTVHMFSVALIEHRYHENIRSIPRKTV